MRAWFLVAALLAAGCSELTQPRPPEPPVDLVGRIAAAPLPIILNNAAADFQGGGAGLTGQPAATALAVARLEWIGGEFRPGRRLARLPNSFNFGMQRAVAEGRSALGMAPDATPEAAVAALLAVSRALSQGDQAAAQAAMSAGIFTAEGRSMRVRLTDPGAFPDAMLATTALRDEVARLVADGQATNMIVFDSMPVGLSTTGLGSTADR